MQTMRRDCAAEYAKKMFPNGKGEKKKMNKDMRLPVQEAAPSAAPSAGGPRHASLLKRATDNA
eukprot:CAMPEP_0117658874 /NCGR_PEP_ID=MMETSP0804-20121206/6104_1 /TAXON_ID=1074897 /ORGANISM="Tetraselmis astigmatica, Strain CCMP880" /LENGTH=62 /DNA_ID=CAMNT_0005465439 /DNA_START=71 /DNA_END=255 /DNA_ORIENTATION=-